MSGNSQVEIIEDTAKRSGTFTLVKTRDMSIKLLKYAILRCYFGINI